MFNIQCSPIYTEYDKIHQNTLQKLTLLIFFVDGSELLAKPEGEPVEDLNYGDEADSKAKSADAAKAGDEV